MALSKENRMSGFSPLEYVGVEGFWRTIYFPIVSTIGNINHAFTNFCSFIMHLSKRKKLKLKVPQAAGDS
jgi:hypothetical protein